MKRLKILLCTVLAMLMSLCLFACGDDPDSQTEPDPEPSPGVEDIQITHHDRTVDAVVYRPDKSRFPVVILSHGFNGSKADFDGVARYLLEYGIGSIAIQFCGSGVHDASGFPTTSMTLFTEKEDLIAVMDYAKALKWYNGSLFLFGGSQGGMVSAMAGHERAADVKGMVLMFAGFSIPDDWNGPNHYPPATYPTYESIPAIIPWWGVNLGRDFVWTLRNLDIYAEMVSFTKPVLLMHGTSDDIVPYEYSVRAKNTYPDAELLSYPGEGHGFTPSTMGDVQEQLRYFIEDNG